MEIRKPKLKTPKVKLEKYGLIAVITICCTALVLTNHLKASDATATVFLAAIIIL